MKLKILLDNTAAEGFESVHGFSVLIEFGKKVLFDAGPNELFVKNAEKLNEDFSDINTVVLSHGHWDHGDGLKHLSGKDLILHPDCFITRHRKRNNTSVGLSMNKGELSKNFNIKESKKPFWISENMVFLGEIPRVNDFESKKSPFLLPDGSPDFVPDDSAIAITSSKGLIVISGCAHSGICNTVDFAKKVCKTNTVYAVIGGFHLKEIDELTIKTIEYLKAENIKILGPTHCTSFKVRDEFAKSFNLLELAAGVVIEL
ncbi:MBL fold metallo-hydrolase [Marinifilum sp. D714]|uniref:MBL fold metallo-hydrolase n=1 Tax=Marinifilum sp. D714 TaxID=2937523 RepID=UPI0027CA74B8|nr:MBL fold metallo-hydrolase [Marinifilum sp. D714]MDQ2179284.1 MBL fold metallo-hydrolase [Marinifilum sp. D714]